MNIFELSRQSAAGSISSSMRRISSTIYTQSGWHPRFLRVTLGVSIAIGGAGEACGGKVIFDTAGAGGNASKVQCPDPASAPYNPSGGGGNPMLDMSGAACMPTLEAGQTVFDFCVMTSGEACPALSDPGLVESFACSVNMGGATGGCSNPKPIVSIPCALPPGPVGQCCYRVVLAAGC